MRDLKTVFHFSLFLLILVLAGSCSPEVRKRPAGYLRIGQIYQFLEQDRFLDDKRLFIRKDSNGLYAMSTSCTSDLAGLKKNTDATLSCSSCSSRFDIQGKVLAGPAVADLPYYALKLDANKVGEAKEMLYGLIGTEVKPAWRLRVHIVE